jgi:hypothetical protein
LTDLIICIVWPAVDPEDGGIWCRDAQHTLQTKKENTVRQRKKH